MKNYKVKQLKKVPPSHYKVISDYSSSGHVIIDSNNKIIYANIAIINLFQVSNSTINGLRFGNAFNCCETDENKITCGQSKHCDNCRIKYLFNPSSKIDLSAVQYKYKYKNSYYCKWLDFHTETIFYKKEKAAMITVHDVTKYIVENIRLKNKLEIDLATGALNKFSLMKKVDNLIKTRNNKSFSACMIDFDDFKIINDTYGHLTGDSVLEVFSTISKEHVQGFDIFGRYGGEEFVFVFIDTTPSQAIDILRHIYEEFNSYLIKDISRPLTLSCGLSYVDKQSTIYKTGTELIGYIDKLLYKAKQTGKNKIVSDNNEYLF